MAQQPTNPPEVKPSDAAQPTPAVINTEVKSTLPANTAPLSTVEPCAVKEKEKADGAKIEDTGAKPEDQKGPVNADKSGKEEVKLPLESAAVETKVKSLKGKGKGRPSNAAKGKSPKDGQEKPNVAEAAPDKAEDKKMDDIKPAEAPKEQPKGESKEVKPVAENKDAEGKPVPASTQEPMKTEAKPKKKKEKKPAPVITGEKTKMSTRSATGHIPQKKTEKKKDKDKKASEKKKAQEPVEETKEKDAPADKKDKVEPPKEQAVKTEPKTKEKAEKKKVDPEDEDEGEDSDESESPKDKKKRPKKKSDSKGPEKKKKKLK